jgi:hypothetical protein
MSNLSVFSTAAKADDQFSMMLEALNAKGYGLTEVAEYYVNHDVLESDLKNAGLFNENPSVAEARFRDALHTIENERAAFAIQISQNSTMLNTYIADSEKPNFFRGIKERLEIALSPELADFTAFEKHRFVRNGYREISAQKKEGVVFEGSNLLEKSLNMAGGIDKLVEHLRDRDIFSDAFKAAENSYPSTLSTIVGKLVRIEDEGATLAICIRNKEDCSKYEENDFSAGGLHGLWTKVELLNAFENNEPSRYAELGQAELRTWLKDAYREERRPEIYAQPKSAANLVANDSYGTVFVSNSTASFG